MIISLIHVGLLLEVSHHFVTPYHIGSPDSLFQGCCHSCGDGQPLPDRYVLICGSMPVTALPLTVTLIPLVHSHCPLQSQFAHEGFSSFFKGRSALISQICVSLSLAASHHFVTSCHTGPLLQGYWQRSMAVTPTAMANLCLIGIH